MPLYKLPNKKPRQLLALAQQAFQPVNATWRMVEALGGRPRVIGELPKSAGLIELLSDAEQTRIVAATYTGGIDPNNAPALIYMLALLVPDFDQASAESFLVEALKALDPIEGTQASLQRWTRHAILDVIWMKVSNLLTVKITYHNGAARHADQSHHATGTEGQQPGDETHHQ